jgi:hypothetical protein
VAENGGDRKAANHGSLLNGSSLSHLEGAQTAARVVTEVRLPASSMADVLSTIARLGHTGSLQVNFHKGRAQDLKWADSRGAKPADI